jgi:chorismate synthase
MRGNSIGKAFSISTFGESHGAGIGVIIDGCPAGIPIQPEMIARELARRKPGQSALTSPRKEDEEFEILSGIFEGKSTGTPIAILIRNQDARPEDYEHLRKAYRPSHADYVWDQKFGFRDHRGGGRSSARETAARVAAAAVAKQLLLQFGIRIAAFTQQVGGVSAPEDYRQLDLSKTEENAVRCPDKASADKMEELIHEVKEAGDSIGGRIRCVCSGVPAGLGEPVFDKLHAELGKAMLSINAARGFQMGETFSSLEKRGSENNDLFYADEAGKIRTKTNHSAGIQGGISNGEDIWFDVAFKPVSTLMMDQQSVDKDGNPLLLEGKGRHDPCVLPRAVPIVEAMAALVLADFFLRARMDKSGFSV